ncbi:hypothetical protein COW53_09775 [bacterium CG17_big_fil_post_rev_8_21_14_2_50_64_8]|nr:MAG: hypothetical protein COW53_09775 [bacterium CG17_big_fil_post_rev_8_21_14_2_50_64_8]PJA76240.1 MAG: hypothetical protein CO151_03665 [bacterium CG_4_9_14_3_um_filter_65_15]
MNRDERRCDLVVILARGDSRRMGTPKGLLSLTEGGPPFAALIAELYRSWADVVLVARHRDVEHYVVALADMPEVEILGGDPGGETALTLWTGWNHSRCGPQATHIWAHPVDMPLVGAKTVSALAAASRRRSEAVVRPTRNEEPGHPVVLPATLLGELAAHDPWLQRPFREFLAWRSSQPCAPEFLALPDTDAGTVQDFDRPGDLVGDGEGAEYV